MRTLTPKQSAFIKEYLFDFNATAAAERAGYQGDRATLAAIGSENLAKPAIRQRIDQAITERAMSAREVLHRLSQRARGSMGDFISETPGGDVKVDLNKAFHSGSLDQVKYIAHQERWDGDTLVRSRFEIALHNALTALIQLSRAYNLPASTLAESDIPTIPTTDPETPEQILTTFLTAVRNVIAWEDEHFPLLDLEETTPE